LLLPAGAASQRLLLQAAADGLQDVLYYKSQSVYDNVPRSGAGTVGKIETHQSHSLHLMDYMLLCR